MSNKPTDTVAKHPFSVIGLVDKAWNNFAEAVVSTGWDPITRRCESLVTALLSKIRTGRLRVLTLSRIYDFPTITGRDERSHERGYEAELRVINDAFWVRLCTMSDLGFAEAYMYGEIECDDLISLFRIFLDNKENISSLDSKLSYLFTVPQTLTSYRFLNTIGNSRYNVSAHYDISNQMFSGFLSEDMTYSCAIFKDLDGDLEDGLPVSPWNGGHGLKRLALKSPQSTPEKVNGLNGNSHETNHRRPLSQDELHEAQIRKLKHIIQKAQIRPGHRVLEIGSGWGSMAILIAQTVPNTRIDTITLSVQQQALARERVAQAGLSDHVEVHLMDYRDMPAEWEGAFDRVISVEMIEAVGAEFLKMYWEVVDWAMKRDSGVGVIQAITIPEALFPGGFLPTLTLLIQTMRTGSKGRLIVDSVSNIGPHYARTLREWRKRFLDRFESVIVPALKKEYPDVMCGPRGIEEIEVFKRKWTYYYCYCEVGFTTRTLGDHIISFVREGYQDYGCNVME